MDAGESATFGMGTMLALEEPCGITGEALSPWVATEVVLGLCAVPVLLGICH